MKKRTQKEIDDKAVVEQKGVGSNNPGGQDSIATPRIRVTPSGKPIFRGITHKD